VLTPSTRGTESPPTRPERSARSGSDRVRRAGLIGLGVLAPLLIVIAAFPFGILKGTGVGPLANRVGGWP